VQAKVAADRWPGIHVSTTGVVFFGTPFRGAQGLDSKVMLRDAKKLYEEGNVQGEILEILAQGNENLQKLRDLFFTTRDKKNPAPIACFFEQKASNVAAILGQDRKRDVVCYSP
jgi:hypothetical protein